MLARLHGIQHRIQSGAGIWLLSSADDSAAAVDGAFVTGFLQVMGDRRWVTPGGAPFVSPSDICSGVNEIFDRNRSG